MQANTLKNIKKNRKSKKVGRGGNKKTYAGRGMNGQRSRSGGKKTASRVNVGRKGFFKSLPKKRGFKKDNTNQIKVISINRIIEKDIKDISIDSLKKAKLLKKFESKVKIIGASNKIDYSNLKLTVSEGIMLSTALKKKINS